LVPEPVISFLRNCISMRTIFNRTTWK